jgi:hypothetical protein
MCVLLQQVDSCQICKDARHPHSYTTLFALKESQAAHHNAGAPEGKVQGGQQKQFCHSKIPPSLSVSGSHPVTQSADHSGQLQNELHAAGVQVNTKIYEHVVDEACKSCNIEKQCKKESRLMSYLVSCPPAQCSLALPEVGVLLLAGALQAAGVAKLGVLARAVHLGVAHATRPTALLVQLDPLGAGRVAGVGLGGGQLPPDGRGAVGGVDALVEVPGLGGWGEGYSGSKVEAEGDGRSRCCS